MKQALLLCTLLSCWWIAATNHVYRFAVVGAGPAGIVATTLLKDLGIPAHDIAWIDPKFTVGDLSLYSSVPSNTKTKLFVDFLRASDSFKIYVPDAIQTLLSYDQEKEYPLHVIVDPLQRVTHRLCQEVCAYQASLTSLYFENDAWHLGMNDEMIVSQNVVLATGSHPRNLHYSCEHEISLQTALNKYELAKEVCSDDVIAVIGSAHSAILVMKFLSELQVSKIINFYKQPLEYVLDPTLTLTGKLGGVAAQWAMEVLSANPPENLLRVYNCKASRDQWLCHCNKIIYAAGFERNHIPIEGMNEITYDDKSGVIASRLFGIGIAFPERSTDQAGNEIYKVGLNSFMEYAQRVIPEWITMKSRKEIRKRFEKFEALFDINQL